MIVSIAIEIRPKFTTFCIAAPDWNENGLLFNIRHLERIPYRAYREVGQRLIEMGAKFDTFGIEGCHIYMNATEIGMPVVNSIRQSSSTSGIQPVFMTMGQVKPSTDEEGISFGKAWLVSRLKVFLQEGRIRLPAALPDAKKLVEEILDFSPRLAHRASADPDFFAVGPRDDLVSALGLAVHVDMRQPVSDSEPRSPVRLPPMPGAELDELYDRLFRGDIFNGL
ncbi:MAG: hypothetical protein AAF481_07880 [Acidobacteriota bacterium]